MSEQDQPPERATERDSDEQDRSAQRARKREQTSPAAPTENPEAEASEGPLYTVTLRGTASNDPSIAGVKVYVAGQDAIKAEARGGRPFTVRLQVEKSGDLSAEYSYVSAFGNESEKKAFTVNIPDKKNLDAPTTDLEVVEIVCTSRDGNNPMTVR